jgi:hypothetical protein
MRNLQGARKLVATVITAVALIAMFFTVLAIRPDIISATVMMVYAAALVGVFVLFTTANYLSKLVYARGQFSAEFSPPAKGGSDAEVATVASDRPGDSGGAPVGPGPAPAGGGGAPSAGE